MRIAVRLFTILLFTFLSSYVFAAHYTYNGIGNWRDTINWEGSRIAPKYMSANDTIIINGTAFLGDPNCRPGGGYSPTPCPMDPFGQNDGTLIISAGGSLTLHNYTQFGNNSAIIIRGTLINETTYEGYTGGTVAVYGTLVNKSSFGNTGLITIENGGVINNITGTFSNQPNGHTEGIIIVKSGGNIKNASGAVFVPGNTTFQSGATLTNAGTLPGTATINGNLDNSGTLAPGNSPGTYTVKGNYTATATAIHNFEVAGTATGAYDALNTNGTVTLNGTLNVRLINGFTPSTFHELPIITGTIAGTFAAVNLPGNYTLVYNVNSVVLRSNISLPVNFVSVAVKKETGGTKLTWKVADEINVERYEVERSSDGKSFAVAGTIKAARQPQYSYTDAPATGTTFYRIKSVDADGKLKYSAIVSIMGEKASAGLKVIPNPAIAQIWVQHKPAATGSKIIVTSAEGRQLLTAIPTPGTVQTSMDVSALSAGVYFLSYAAGNGEKEITKFIKQ